MGIDAYTPLVRFPVWNLPDFLHKPAKSIPLEESMALAEDLIYYARQKELHGIAAPQFNKSGRVFVLKNEDDYQALINPKIKRISGTSWSEESCLSIAHFYAPLLRPSCVEIEFTDVSGDNRHEVYFGIQAQIIMHEYDHLNGILITDRALAWFGKGDLSRKLTLVNTTSLVR